MKLLMHTCCAPCFIGCKQLMDSEKITPDLFWYNPNIHLFTEYKARKEALSDYAKSENLNIIYEDNYGLREFISDIYPDFSRKRCEICYKKRIEKAVLYAKSGGYDAFSTTLLVSPYQNHELIIKICNEMQEKYLVEFFYKDFRPYFRQGQKVARESGVYMQKYCGCVFSEEERYLKI